MKTVIEISADKAKIVQVHKNKITRSTEFTLDFMGSYLSDLAEKIKVTNWKLKNVTLLINNNDVLYREMTLPDIDAKKMFNVIANELKNSSANNEDYISDYIELSKEDGKIRILTTSITKANIESYLEFCKKIGCKGLDRIDVGYNALFNYFEKTELIKDTSAKLLIDVGARFMRIYLFENGGFVLVRTIRFTQIVKAEQMVQQIVDEMSKMLQFQISRHTGFDINGVYFFGDHEEVGSVVEYIKSRTDVECETLPKIEAVQLNEEFEYLKNVYVLGSIVRK